MRRYHIVISSAHREYLVTALRQCQLQGYFGADPADRTEIDLLTGMLDELDEAFDPDDNPDDPDGQGLIQDLTTEAQPPNFSQVKGLISKLRDEITNLSKPKVPVMSYLSRSAASRAAVKNGWTNFRTFYDRKVSAWYVRKVEGFNPANEWVEQNKPDFVHHTEVDFVEDARGEQMRVGVLVVSCFRNELPDTIPENLIIEPLTLDLWRDIPDSASTGGDGPRERSAIESPVKAVWRIASEMVGADRKAVIAACVAAGVNKATASTQYYKWSLQNKA